MRALLALPVLVAALGTAVGAGAGAVTCGWHVVLDRPGPQLAAVAAVNDGNVWAVGTTADRGAIFHWDGHGWWPSPAPILPLDVTAGSARNVWIVGSSSPPAFISRAASAHWDGSRWTRVPVPGGPGTYLRGVSTRSSGVWAVGAGDTGPLIVRWTGRAWRAVPTAPADGLLHAVARGWAVGTQGESSATNAGSEDPLVEHLAGGVWRIVITPAINSVDENLLAISADSPRDVWAVGSEDIQGGRAPLIQHLFRSKWFDESVVGLPRSQVALTAVSAFGPSDVWVAGYHGFSPQRTLLAHWNGTRWAQAPSHAGALTDLAALSPRDMWAVGGSQSRSLVERYSCS